MGVLTIIESMLSSQTIVTRALLLIFVFGIMFVIIRGGKK